MTLEIQYYRTPTGEKPFVRWFERLEDRHARTRIDARLSRVAVGNPGDVRPVGKGVLELRIDWGPGYRVYFAKRAERIILLLCAGDKRTQQRDIHRAKTYLQDYDARVRSQASGNGT